MDFRAPKGTRDIYPQDMMVRNYIFDKWRQTAKIFGFEEYDGPMFESLELFTRKSGNEIVGQLYNFKDKGGRELALRPELTPTLARMVNQVGKSAKYPLRWFSIPRLFRYERMQKGRLREFFQLNLDIVGTSSIKADAELIASVASMLNSFGLTKEDYRIKISSRELIQNLIECTGVDSKKVPEILFAMDRQEKESESVYEKRLTDIGLTKEQIDKVSSIGKLDSIDSIIREFPTVSAEKIEDIKNVFYWLNHYGISDVCEFNTSIVRGLAYYTGIVFEVHARTENMRAIAGGGRYDHLTEALGGAYCPATGFAIGDVVLENLLRQKGLLSVLNKDVDCYVVAIGQVAEKKAITITTNLRTNGIASIFSIDSEKTKKQFKRANDAGCKVAVILGEEEIQKNTVRVKNMGTGDEIVLSEKEIYGRIKSMLS